MNLKVIKMRSVHSWDEDIWLMTLGFGWKKHPWPDLRYHNSYVYFFRSVFGRIEDTKKSLWNLLTFISLGVAGHFILKFFNPRLFNPELFNPELFNPWLFDPSFSTPDFSNPNFQPWTLPPETWKVWGWNVLTLGEAVYFNPRLFKHRLFDLIEVWG